MKRSPYKLDSRILSELRGQKRFITLGLACTIVTALLYGGTLALLKKCVEMIESIAREAGLGEKSNPVLQAQNLQILAWVCVAVVFNFLLRYFFTRGSVLYLNIASNRLTADLRRRLLTRLLRLPIGYFSDKRVGAVQSVVSNDVNVFQMAIGIIRESIEAPLKATVALVAIFLIKWQLALITLLMVPVLAVVIQRNNARMKSATHQVQENLAEVGATTTELLQGVRVVKAFGAEERTAQDYETLNERLFAAQLRSAKITASLRPMVELIGASALAVVFYISGMLASKGQLQFADVAALAFAMDTVNQGFRSLGSLSNTAAQVQTAVDRLYANVFDLPEESSLSGSRTLTNVTGKLEFKNVSFTYPDGTTALENVSFVIEPGESLALVGPSGSGKSTVADLVQRFYEPSSGQILLDGVDIRELDVEFLRGLIGVVPQHTFLFVGSIEDNVRLGSPNASDADVHDALAKSNALDFTLSMNDRESSSLGERGTKLSGGQMQRVAIARAILRQPKLLLLDEATSALDATSEKLVTEALEEVMHNRTTLFIAHRLTTAARADKIVLLNRGTVIEQGSHQELMAKNGEYAALFRVFSSGLFETEAS